MADIEKIKIGNTHYDIKDATAVKKVATLPETGEIGEIVQYTGTDHYTRDLHTGCFYRYDNWGTGRITIEDPGPFTTITITNYDKFQELVDNTIGRHAEDYLITFTCQSSNSYWKITVGGETPNISRGLDSWYISTNEVASVTAGDSFTLMVENTSEEAIKWKRISNFRNGYNDVPIIANDLYGGDIYYPFKYALSARQGAVLKGLVDNISSIGRFLAMWDADTGTARYLNTGFAYKAGDYFIVATVAGSGGTNYMPNGSSYTGPSSTVATDTLYLSDMYYYTGSIWVYMAHHERAIAIDDMIDPTSTNPVENRVITAALGTKQNTLDSGTGITIDTDSVISVDTTVIQPKLTASTGITLDDDNNISVDETTIQHKLTAGDNITITDNVISAAGGGSGSGLPCISTVEAKQYTNYGKYQEHQQYTYFRKDFEEIMFTTNLDPATLFSKKNDLYVGTYRSKRNKNKLVEGDYLKLKRKMTLQNDQRVKTNVKIFCWRFDTNADMDWRNPARYVYFYVAREYADAQALVTADPSIGLYIDQLYSPITGEFNTSNYGTCFNAINFSDSWCVTDITNDAQTLERCPEHDIDEIAPMESITTSEVLDAKYARCREAIKISDGSKHFIWGIDLTGEDTTAAILTTSSPTYIPDFMGDLVNGGTVADYTLGNWRHDLKYLVFDTSSLTGARIANEAYNCTHGGHTYPTTYFWRVYWMDYPMKLFRLADCEVLVNIQDNAMPEEYKEDLGTYIRLKDLESKPYKNLFKQMVFKYPYATDELWLRFCSWQKRVLYQYEQEDLGLAPSDKNSMDKACYYWHNEETFVNYGFYRRAFGKQSNQMMYNAWNPFAKTTEAVQFSLLTADEVGFNLAGQSTPVKKRLASTANGSFLID